MARIPRALQPVLFVLLAVAVGAAGVFVGSAVRTRIPGTKRAMVTTRVPTSLLEVGDAFPDAVLVGEDGEHVSSLDIVPAGGVVLFLDLECSPCEDMAARWQRALDGGVLDGAPVCAVTYHPRERIERFKAEHGLHFPVYQDSLQTFRADYRVDRFPLEVVVGQSGRIRSTSYNYNAPIDPVGLHVEIDD